MTFIIGDRLDFLMKVSDTRNSALGRALNFDPSYISRIRAGKRGVPKHQPFIESAAEYFAGRLTESYQRKIAADTLCPGKSWPESRKEAAALIARWLSRPEDEEQGEREAERFLSGLAASPVRPELPAQFPIPRAAVPQGADTAFYYGNEGKRRGVERFLTELCALDEPQTLLLWSDEDMSWLDEDPAFVRRWAALLLRLLRTGGRIRIVHTVSRGMREMLSGITKWLPLYMTGAIEAWYCPLPRDSVVRRTLFVARGRAALASSSIRGAAGDMLNLLVYDRQAVAALEQEILSYFELCAPLMEIYLPSESERDRQRFLTAFRRSFPAPGHLIRAGGLPVLPAPPEEVKSADWFDLLQRELSEDLRRRLRGGGQVTEILRLPPPEEVLARPVTLPLGSLLGLRDRVVSARELARELRSLTAFARREANYRVVLSREIPENLLLRAVEGSSVLVARTDRPSAVFHIREGRMTGSLWEYLRGIMEHGDNSAAALEDYISQLESGR